MKLHHVSLITWRTIFKIYTSGLCRMLRSSSQTDCIHIGQNVSMLGNCWRWVTLKSSGQRGETLQRTGLVPGRLDATLKHLAAGFAGDPPSVLYSQENQIQIRAACVCSSTLTCLQDLILFPSAWSRCSREKQTPVKTSKGAALQMFFFMLGHFRLSQVLCCKHLPYVIITAKIWTCTVLIHVLIWKMQIWV